MMWLLLLLLLPLTKLMVNGKEVTKEEYDKAVEDISSFLSFVNKIWDII